MVKHRNDQELLAPHPIEQGIRKAPQQHPPKVIFDDMKSIRPPQSTQKRRLEGAREFHAQAVSTRLVPSLRL